MEDLELAALGKRIALLREAAGLSQGGLAVRAGVHKMTVSKWERGVQEPGALQLAALARAMGISPLSILSPDFEGDGTGYLLAARVLDRMASRLRRRVVAPGPISDAESEAHRRAMGETPGPESEAPGEDETEVA